MTPINRAKVNPRITSPPKRKMASNTKKVLSEVLNVRLRVLFRAVLKISLRSLFRCSPTYSLILSKMITWMRGQPGTSDLRALIYMDEVFGYVPPTAAPPAKKPILTILKQARAHGVGMVLSTLFLEVAKRSLGHVGLPPKGKEGWGMFFIVGIGALAMAVAVYFLLSESTILGFLLVGIMLALIAYFIISGIRSGDRVQLHRYIAMIILFAANACFWALFEQAGSSMNFFAREFVTPMFGSMEAWQSGGFGIFQSLNPLYILLLAPAFAAFWPWLDKRGVNPSIPRKFALGLIQVAAGFYILVFAIANFQNAAGMVPWIFLALTYLLHTTGELCLSPIGLSMVTKLAAEKETGMAMGGWFLATSIGNKFSGFLGNVQNHMEPMWFFVFLAGLAALVALFIFLVLPRLDRAIQKYGA